MPGISLICLSVPFLITPRAPTTTGIIVFIVVAGMGIGLIWISSDQLNL